MLLVINFLETGKVKEERERDWMRDRGCLRLSAFVSAGVRAGRVPSRSG